MGSRKRIAGAGLPEDCWEYVLSKLLNNENDDRGKRYLEILSLVSKQLLDITNRSMHSVTLIYNPSPLSRLFQRFPNLTSLDLSCFRGDLNILLSRIPRSVYLSRLTSLNLSNHPTFPTLGFHTILNNTTISSTLTSLTCSNIGSLHHTHISFIADSFPFLQQLDISFPKIIIPDDNDHYNNALKLLTQKLSKLRKVNLSGHFYLNDSSFFQLCINCVFLQEVVMFQCHFLTRAGLASAICQRPTLNSFSLTCRKDITSYFIVSLLSLKGLTCLDFSFSLITDELLCLLALEALPLRKPVLHKCFGHTNAGISHLLSRCRSLQHLDLGNFVSKFLNVQSFIDLCVFLGDLVSINLNGCDKLNNAALIALLKNCPLLTEIHMESTQLGIGSRPSVVDLVVYHQVKSLHLAYNTYLQDEDITMFSFMFPNMQLLDLSSCDDICIVKVLKRCCNIRHLKFAFCPRAKLPWTNIEASKLEVLDLSNSRIDGEALYAVSKIFPRLLQLDLEHCYHVTEKGVRLVVENCMHLREINLRSCPKVSTKIVSWMIFSRPSLRKITAPPQFRPRDCDRKLLFRRCLVC